MRSPPDEHEPPPERPSTAPPTDQAAQASIWKNPVLRTARRVVIGIVGGTIVLIGIALLFLPGPAAVVIPIGLGVLGLEFAFARRWLRRLRAGAEGLGRVLTRNHRTEASRSETAKKTPARTLDDT